MYVYSSRDVSDSTEGGNGQGKDVSLRVEDEVVHVQDQVFFFGEQQVQVLECLCEDKRVHSVRVGGREGGGRITKGLGQEEKLTYLHGCLSSGP